MNISKTKRNHELANDIFSKRMDAKVIELEYRGGNNTCLKRAYGELDKVILADSYVRHLENQLNYLDEQLLPIFSSSLRNHFKVKVQIKPNGEFDFDNLRLEIRVDFQKCTGFSQMLTRVEKAFLPFAENINAVQIFGNNHKLTYSLADMLISLEDLKLSIEEPLISPRAATEWGIVYQQAYSYAKDTFNYDVKVPCVEGELLFDTAQVCVQVQQTGYIDKKISGVTQ